MRPDEIVRVVKEGKCNIKWIMKNMFFDSVTYAKSFQLRILIPSMHRLATVCARLKRYIFILLISFYYLKLSQDWCTLIDLVQITN